MAVIRKIAYVLALNETTPYKRFLMSAYLFLYTSNNSNYNFEIKATDTA